MDDELLKEFLEESLENLSGIDADLTQYEKEPENLELLNSIYRKVHTLKGSASFLGFQDLQELIHNAENVLSMIREGELAINSEITDTLLGSMDKALVFLDNIAATGKEGKVDYKSLLLQLLNYLSPSDEKAPKKENGNIKFTNDISPKSDNGIKIIATQLDESLPDSSSKNSMKEKKADMEKQVQKKEAPKSKATAPASTPSKAAPAKSASSTIDSTIKVNVQSLDRIMNVVGELVLTRNQILQFATLNESPELAKLSQQLNGITTELQTDIMTTRMQPIGSVLNKFERVIRELARSQGKNIKVEISGQETELDKSLLEGIRDPLTHLVRNSADHGVESPEERIAAGKNEEGRIFLRAYHEGGMVIVEIQDDGKGIDPKKIINKAIEKGLITPEQGQKMGDKKAFALLFLPGFSTAEKVTNISGRGVGMDVVRTNIEKMGGSVDVLSEFGKGSTFRLKIPLTLAIVPALIVNSEGEHFAIPQINLVELVRLEGKDIEARIEKLHDSEFFRLRGELISLFRLNSSLKLEEVKTKSEGLIKSVLEDRNQVAKEEDKAHAPEEESVNIVVLQSESHTYGLIVDSILDTQEIVVKPLSSMSSNSNLFAGATIMGDGKVALILDTVGFYNTIGGHSADEGNVLEDDDGEVTLKEDTTSQDIILFDLEDGRTYSMVLTFVNRLEEFKTDKIEWSGEQALIRYRGHSMPLVNVESMLNFPGPAVFDRDEKEKPEKFDCLVILKNEHFYGLVVKEILDITSANSTLETDTIDRKGLLGTYFVHEKTISVLDVDHLISTQRNMLQGSSSSSSEAVGKIFLGKRALLVDDSSLYRKVEGDFLKDLGIEFVTSINGVDGIEKIKKEEKEFDFIITDIEMPKMDGFEFAGEVRKLEAYKNTPIIAITTKTSPRDRKRGEEIGIDEYIEKFDKDKLLKFLKQHWNM